MRGAPTNGHDRVTACGAGSDHVNQQAQQAFGPPIDPFRNAASHGRQTRAETIGDVILIAEPADRLTYEAL